MQMIVFAKDLSTLPISKASPVWCSDSPGFAEYVLAFFSPSFFTYLYGFIVRYPKGKTDITGYIYEPWHVRYLGEKKAKDVYLSGLTLEEYLGVN